jgi:putative ATPase
MSMVPLAERMRPETLADVVGQEHLVATGKIIHEIIAKKQPVSLILWGPPGSGKTTLARIIAKETDAEFIELSAVTSGKADVVKVIEHAKQNQRLAQRTILFVDEIHRFNKAQQDAFCTARRRRNYRPNWCYNRESKLRDYQPTTQQKPCFGTRTSQ